MTAPQDHEDQGDHEVMMLDHDQRPFKVGQKMFLLGEYVMENDVEDGIVTVLAFMIHRQEEKVLVEVHHPLPNRGLLLIVSPFALCRYLSVSANDQVVVPHHPQDHPQYDDEDRDYDDNCLWMDRPAYRG